MEVLEEWRDVVGYEGLYAVSNLGAVRSLKFGKVRYMKCYKSKNGYSLICLYKNSKKKRCSVHRLAYTAFNGTVPEGMQIDHIDGDKTNNTVGNLRAVSPKVNTNNPVTRVHHLEATRKANSKPILQINDSTGEVIREWPSAREAARALSIDYTNISACCNGKRNSAGGYRWCFALANCS